MRHSADVIVVGGGVIGLTTAFFLGKAGASVILCEQGKTGMEASWAGAGIIPPSDLEHAQYPLDRLRALSVSLFPDLSRELLARTGIDNGFMRSGGLELINNSAHADSEEWYGLGVQIDTISAADARTLEPALSAGLGRAIHIPCMAQVRNPRHLQALRAACLDLGNVVIHQDAAVLDISVVSSRAKGVRLSDEELTGSAVLVTAGAWTGRLLEPLGQRLNVPPVRGQIALLNPGKRLFQHILLSGSRYLVPRQDGLVLIGSTEEQVGYDKATTAAGIGALLELGLTLVPALAGATLEKTWAGLRPGSPDGVPFIGPVPGIENLYVGAGHFRAGIQLSPGTAQLLTEMLLGKPLTMPMDAFRIDRQARG
ncbi:MAG: glycine oxidase ThiO [Planctomycetes bacterium]|nr:glycine oxidase ThiO [Planctomycetota bacterium]